MPWATTRMPDTAPPPSEESRRPALPQRNRRVKALSSEDTFGKVFDGNVVKRFGEFLIPYRRQIYMAIASVIIFTLTQISVPLIIRYIVDKALVVGAGGERLLLIAVVGFFFVSLVNYVSNYFQTIVVAKMAERILNDLRGAMYGHLQHVSLAFMDRTQVGRLMSRLQGDVGSLQEFLESSIFAIGDFVLLFGIVFVLLMLDVQLGLLTLSVLPILFIVRVIWLPIARRAFMHARQTNSIVNSALAENINGVRTVQEMGRQGVNFDAFEDKAALIEQHGLGGTLAAMIAVGERHRILADVDAIEVEVQTRVHRQRLAPIGRELRAPAHDAPFVAGHERDARRAKDDIIGVVPEYLVEVAGIPSSDPRRGERLRSLR